MVPEQLGPVGVEGTECVNGTERLHGTVIVEGLGAQSIVTGLSISHSLLGNVLLYFLEYCLHPLALLNI